MLGFLFLISHYATDTEDLSLVHNEDAIQHTSLDKCYIPGRKRTSALTLGQEGILEQDTFSTQGPKAACTPAGAIEDDCDSSSAHFEAASATLAVENLNAPTEGDIENDGREYEGVEMDGERERHSDETREARAKPDKHIFTALDLKYHDESYHYSPRCPLTPTEDKGSALDSDLQAALLITVHANY